MVARIHPRLCCTTATAQPGVVVAAHGAGASGAAGTPPQAPARGGTSPARPDRQRTVTSLWKTELYCSSKHAHSRLRLQTRPRVALAPSACAVRLPCSSAARDGRAGTCPRLGALTRLPGPAQPQRYQPCRSCWLQEPPGKQLVGPRAHRGGQCAIPTATGGLASLAPAQGGCCWRGCFQQPAPPAERCVGARDARSRPQTAPRGDNYPEAGEGLEHGLGSPSCRRRVP